MGCNFPLLCGRNKNTCCNECNDKSGCNSKCQLLKEECDDYVISDNSNGYDLMGDL